MLEIKTEKFDVKIDDTVFELSYPTVGQFESYSEIVEKDESAKSYNKAMFLLLEECGLPMEVSRKLQNKHLQLIIEELAGTKK